MRRKALTWFLCVVATWAAGCSRPAITTSTEGPRLTVVAPGDGLHLGSGWYPIEQYEGKTFRWVNNNAEITACPDASHSKISIDLEPGPSVGSKNMTLIARLNDGTTQQIIVRDRRVVTIAIAKDRPQTLLLHVASRNLPVPHEKRTLNFRVFSVALGSNADACPKDIVRDGSPLKLGAGWYTYETSAGNSFRWVNTNAEIFVTKAMNKPYLIEADVEPGPGLNGKPLVVTLADAQGLEVAKAKPVSGRSIITLTVPHSSADQRFKLDVISQGMHAPGDSRTLNFRVFDLHAMPLTN